MRFGEILVGWLAASLVAYCLAAAASAHIVLGQLVDMGAEVTMVMRVQTIWHDILNLSAYLYVIGAGFLIAFYVASLVKALIPVLAPVAYPIAGAAAIATALGLMRWQFDVFPISGAEDQIGYALQLIAGAVGGGVFEIIRPKTG
ncbi:MAG: hypothetical protein AAF986_04940 [Pseudomonadota bacterium]